MGKESDQRLLVSCVNERGGLYKLEWDDNAYALTKIVEGSCRGVTKYRNEFVAVMDHALLVLNETLDVIRGKQAHAEVEYHGVFVEGGKAYIVETKLNTIGIYDLADLSRKGELAFAPTGRDLNHINDLYIDKSDGTMLLSMFTQKGFWRHEKPNSGVIAAYDRKTGTIGKVLYRGLSRPHSVLCRHGRIYYCDSAQFEVKQENDVLFKAEGFTRGLAVTDRYMYVGQSNSRLVTNGQCRCGIWRIDRKNREAPLFVPLPSEEVYGIQPYGAGSVYDQEK